MVDEHGKYKFDNAELGLVPVTCALPCLPLSVYLFVCLSVSVSVNVSMSLSLCACNSGAGCFGCGFWPLDWVVLGDDLVRETSSTAGNTSYQPFGTSNTVHPLRPRDAKEKIRKHKALTRNGSGNGTQGCHFLGG